jgi:hypothetical protein
MSPHMVRAIGIVNMTSFISQKHRDCIAKEHKRVQFTHERDIHRILLMLYSLALHLRIFFILAVLIYIL